MKNRYRLIRRGSRSKNFYCVDTQTKKRTSLGKVSADEAKQIVTHKNTAQRQPMINLQIAKAYLAGTDSGVTTRTWGHALQYPKASALSHPSQNPPPTTSSGLELLYQSPSEMTLSCWFFLERGSVVIPLVIRDSHRSFASPHTKTPALYSPAISERWY